MFKVTTMRGWQLAAAATLLAAAGAAQAQWMWIDAKGLKQVSDRPPPASIPAKNILKTPLKAAPVDPAVTADGTPVPGPVVELHGTAPPGDTASGTGWTEREAEYRKRKAEQAAADKKAADTAQQSGKKENACLLSQARKAQLDSGARIRTGEGRNEFMSDQERAEKIAATAAAIAKNCP